MADKDTQKVDKEIKRIDGQLYETLIINDDQGNPVQSFDIPLKVEVKLQDIFEIMVGASILAIPIAFTEEVWNLGRDLSFTRVFLLNIVAILFIGSFVYFKSYRQHLTMFRYEYIKRVLSIFLLSVLIVGVLLTIVNKCPWDSDIALAMKRILIGAFPAAMSATVTDTLN